MIYIQYACTQNVKILQKFVLYIIFLYDYYYYTADFF